MAAGDRTLSEATGPIGADASVAPAIAFPSLGRVGEGRGCDKVLQRLIELAPQFGRILFVLLTAMIVAVRPQTPCYALRNGFALCQTDLKAAAMLPAR
jgi:hypothetical protein